LHDSWPVTIAVLVITIYSIVLHEVAHAYSAFLLGDTTAARQGRLTLNPIKHIDPFWTIVLPLVTWFGSGGRFIFGGAKPVPVAPYAFKKLSRGWLITAAAGPLTNIAIAAFFALLVKVRVFSPVGSFNYSVFMGAMLMNVYLAAFNLLPVPPRAGSRIVAALLPRELSRQYEKLERFGWIPLIILFVTGLHWPVIVFLRNLILTAFGFREVW